MTEDYLPVKESLGYKNVRQSLMEIFGLELNDINIRDNQFEAFSFEVEYASYIITMLISDTQKRVPRQFGEGGIFDIIISNPRDEWFGSSSLADIPTDEETHKRLRWVSGKKPQDIEFAMQTLKDFLDSDEAEKLIPKTIAELDTTSIDAIGIQEGKLALLLVDGNVWVDYTDQDHLLKLQEKINNYLHYLESKQYVSQYGDTFDGKVIEIRFQYEPSERGLAFLVQVQKALQGTDMSLKVVLLE